MASISTLGVQVGHWSDPERRTGCTVVLCPPGTTAGVYVAGGAPGTHETDLLQPGRLVEQVHAVVLTGGSAWGLAAVTGVMRWLGERQIGFEAGAARVPIVPAAVLFDLGVGDPRAFPDADAGYAACTQASSTWQLGAVGAGTGATVGKVLGIERAAPAGIGSSVRQLPDGALVAALLAVNAWGHVVDPRTGAIVAGASDATGAFVDSEALVLGTGHGGANGFSSPNTTIGVVVTNVPLDKAACTRLAVVAHTGLARCIRPVHTSVDGDTLFVLSVPQAQPAPAPRLALEIGAATVVADAVLSAVHAQR